MPARITILTGVLAASLVAAPALAGAAGLRRDADAIAATGATGVQARATTDGRTRVVTAGVEVPPNG